jgi:hypothetical protein
MSKDIKNCQVLVAHTCNPSYSGGRDQEDQGSKPARSNSLQEDPISKKKTKNKKTNPSQKSTGGVAQSIGPKFKLQYHTHTHTNL